MNYFPIRTQLPEWRAWCKMRDRCECPTCPDFKNYGGRGIKICDRWWHFENFFSDMGERPSPKHTLDRIDVNGNYEPGNCRWITRQEQFWNMRKTIWVEYRGKRQALAAILKDHPLPRNTVIKRLLLGWPVDEALETPARMRGKK